MRDEGRGNHGSLFTSRSAPFLTSGTLLHPLRLLQSAPRLTLQVLVTPPSTCCNFFTSTINSPSLSSRPLPPHLVDYSTACRLRPSRSAPASSRTRSATSSSSSSMSSRPSSSRSAFKRSPVVTLPSSPGCELGNFSNWQSVVEGNRGSGTEIRSEGGNSQIEPTTHRGVLGICVGETVSSERVRMGKRGSRRAGGTTFDSASVSHLSTPSYPLTSRLPHSHTLPHLSTHSIR